MLLKVFVCFYLLLYSSLCFSQFTITYDVRYQKVYDEEKVKVDESKFNKYWAPIIDGLSKTTATYTSCEKNAVFFLLESNGMSKSENLMLKALINLSTYYNSLDGSLNHLPSRRLLVTSEIDSIEVLPKDKTSVIEGYQTQVFEFVCRDLNGSIMKTIELHCCLTIPSPYGFRDISAVPGAVLYYNDGEWEFKAKSVTLDEDCTVVVPNDKVIEYGDLKSYLLKHKSNRS